MGLPADNSESQPSWAAWIEMVFRSLALSHHPLSQPSWAAWIEIAGKTSAELIAMSQPSWAAWIEIPQQGFYKLMPKSQPSWAAWIEIKGELAPRNSSGSRSPLGLRGLKYCHYIAFALVHRRSPLGLRGLKSQPVAISNKTPYGRSPLGLRGLKLPTPAEPARRFCRSPLGLRGLKYKKSIGKIRYRKSQPSWAAWIEIVLSCLYYNLLAVAALLGCVD